MKFCEAIKLNVYLLCNLYSVFSSPAKDNDPTVNLSSLTQETDDTFIDRSSIPSNKVTINDANEVDELKMVLVTEENLLDLARQRSSYCDICHSSQELEIARIGTACVIEWVTCFDNIVKKDFRDKVS